MTRENRIKELVASACMVSRGTGKSTTWILESAADLERLDRVEALLNDPVNRASGSVSIAKLREALK